MDIIYGYDPNMSNVERQIQEVHQNSLSHMLNGQELKKKKSILNCKKDPNQMLPWRRNFWDPKINLKATKN